MFLATTALSEFWDPSGQLLFLGLWCTRHDQQDRWAHRDYLFLPNPWDDRERLWQAAFYCQGVHDHLLGDLSLWLNKVHQVNFGQRYWQILLGPWLSGFVHVFFDRYVHINEAFAFCPELQTWLLDEGEYVTPWDNWESTALQTGDIYNLQLYSQIIISMGHEFPRKKPSPLFAGPQPPARKNPLGWLKGVLRKLEPLIMETGFPNKEVVLLNGNLSKRVKLRLALTPGFRGSFIYQQFPPGRVDHHHPARRELAAVTTTTDPFVRLLVQTLPRNFPGLYLEGYQSSRKLILNRYGSRNLPKLLLNWGSLWYDEYGKFLAGEMVERGGGIIDFQHGAGFGFTRLLGIESYTRQVSDKFYTWGWAGQENDPRLVNLPGAQLSLKSRQPGTSSRHRMIMVVGGIYPRFLYRFQSCPLGTQWLRYIQSTMEFIEAVGPQRQGVLFYRGHPVDYGWGISEQVKERFPHVAVDHHDHSFRYQMHKSRVVVFDHPGTAFLEAMAANVPSVIFFDPKHWDSRSEAQPYLDLLHRAGIFHDTPQSAARQVARVYDHIDSWWFCRSVQDARKRFVNHFALNSPDWNRQWVNAITRELHEIQARQEKTGNSLWSAPRKLDHSK
jgi:putative transferase (TIGR04331 family)